MSDDAVNKAFEYPDFFRVAKRLACGKLDLGKGESKDADQFGKQDIEPAALVDSNVITSQVLGGMHKVAIDLDMDAALIPSSTPGHHHLIIDKELSWKAYSKLLDALHEAGLIEWGYWKASTNRGSTVLRTPWTKKDA